MMRLPLFLPAYFSAKFSLIFSLTFISILTSFQANAELTAICIEHYIRAGAIPQGPNAPWRDLLTRCEIPASTANYGGLGSPRCGNRTDQITEFCGKPCPNTDTDAAIAACFVPTYDPDKSKGPGCGSEGNPCDPATGNKFETEEDYASHNGFLRLTRFYNSLNPADGPFGFGWTATNLSMIKLISSTEVMVVESSGRGEKWSLEGGIWKGDTDSRMTLVKSATAYVARYQDATIKIFNIEGQLIQQTDRSALVTSYGYDANNRLATISSSLGRTLNFSYDNNHHVQNILTPDGFITYQYSASGNLINVHYPDNTHRTYHYDDVNFQHHLTGITDENNHRYATWSYDSDGKASSSEHAGGVDKVTFSYDMAQNQTTVTGALGDTRTYTFSLLNGINKTTTVTGEKCRTCDNGFIQNRTYDGNGFLISYTDWKGNQTTLINNARGLPTQQTDAVGTPQERVTTTVWHNVLSFPVSITKPNKKTTFTYNVNGQLLTRTITDLSTHEARTTSYTYQPAGSNGAGLIASINGPRTDVTDVRHYEYDQQGNLKKFTNEAGHITRIMSHDNSGRPVRILDANNVSTTLSWDLQGRLIRLNTAGDIISFKRDLVGQLTKVTQADGRFLNYVYDDAHRLTGISDSADNKLKYVLDKMGNRISTSITDTVGNIAYSQTAVFDKVSQLQKLMGANSQQQILHYDLNHNLLDSTDALNHKTNNRYDALDRLIKSIDPDAKATDFEYDNQDNLTKVTDAKGLETTYAYNGFGEVISQTSPDTGITTFNYDKAGNLTSKTDARGITIHYQYDALNRLTAIDYPDDTLDVAHSYDAGSYGVGHLTQTQDASGINDYQYDQHGNLVSQIRRDGQVSFTTRYQYNPANRLSHMIYPSGLSLQFQRAANGKITQINATFNGITQTLTSNASYVPLGPLKAFTYGNGLAFSSTYDNSFRLIGQNIAGIQGNIYQYDNADNLIVFNNSLNAALNQQFNYDAVDRLSTANGAYGAYQYVFDSVGNRTQKTIGGGDEDYQYGTTNHHLQSITGLSTANYQYDGVGNTINNGSQQFNYGDDNRLHRVKQGANDIAQYTYNAKGQRIFKQTFAGNAGGAMAVVATHNNDQVLKRGDMAKALLEAINIVPTPVATGRLYSDVNANMINANWIETFSTAGFTEGCSTDRYCPNHVVTREQMAKIFLKVAFGAGYVPTPSNNAFNDTSTNAHNAAWITTLRDLGFSEGCEADRYCPKQVVSWGWFNALLAKLAILNDGSAGETRYFYDQSGRLISEFTQGKFKNTVYFNGQPLANIENGQLYFYHNNHQGTPEVMTDKNQNVVWKASYTPYGKATITTETITNNIRLPGQYFDHETGLHYNYFRYYDAEAGRYVSSDPIGLAGGINTYGYVLGNPLRYIDSLGLKKQKSVFDYVIDSILPPEVDDSDFLEMEVSAPSVGAIVPTDLGEMATFKMPNPEVPGFSDMASTASTMNNMANSFNANNPTEAMNTFYSDVFGDNFADVMKPYADAFFNWDKSPQPSPPALKPQPPSYGRCTSECPSCASYY